MSPSTVKERTEVISVVCSMSLAEMPQDVKALEERIMERVRMSGREFYALCFGALQQRWLQEHRKDHIAVRWRTIDQLTPFGLIRLPVRVVRERGKEKGGYFTLSKAVLKPKATRLLSPWVEKRALEAASCLNYRPAAAELLRWLQVRVSAWLIWKCVQFHGARLCEQLERGWWPDRAQARRVKAPRQPPAAAALPRDAAIHDVVDRRGKLDPERTRHEDHSRKPLDYSTPYLTRG
jgi:hypothetical protein